ncbi:hypothetical protein MCEMIHM37_00936 [Candidatus Methylopumilus planktonicus]
MIKLLFNSLLLAISISVYAEGNPFADGYVKDKAIFGK